MKNTTEKLKKIIIESVGEDLVLPLNEIGTEQSLKSYGLDSLNTIKLLISIENSFNIEFSSNEILNDIQFSINDLSELILKKTVNITSKGGDYIDWICG